ncbi:condensation domain-containing protein [Streptosporangium sp. KLBMP 9127]|nr:AMP-binding protein [Streptosporangium sp. KLBMP 9127]
MSEPALEGIAPHPAQQRLLAGRAALPGGLSCTSAFQISGALDEQRLATAYVQALSGFDALRMRWSGDVPAGSWHVHSTPRFRLRRADLRPTRPLVDGRPGPALLGRLEEHAAATFDLRRGPVGEVHIWRVHEDQWIVLEVFDHIVADGRSLALLHEAVSAHYHGPRSAAQRTSYAAVLSATRPGAGSRAYWTSAFAGFDPATPPPADGGAAQFRLSLPPGRTARLRAATGRLGSTMAGALLAAHSHAVARHLGTGDISTEVAVDTRDIDALQTFGQLTALLPLRIRHDWARPIGRQAATVTRDLLRLRQHAVVDFDTLDDLGVPLSAGRSDATAFIMQPFTAAPLALPDAEVTPIALRSTDQVACLTTVAREQPDGSVHLHVRTGPTSPLSPLIVSVGETMDATLAGLESDPDVRCGSDELLPPSVRARITALATPSPPYPFASLEDDILRSLTADGARIVLVDDRPHSAHDLLARVHDLAQRLRAAGVGHGDLVVVHDLPTFDRIAAFIAVLRLGAVYTPADPPSTASTPVAARLTADGLEPAGSRRPAAPPAPLGPGSPTYVIFTSGSTGVPKGVVVSREALNNLVRGEAGRYGITDGSRVLLIAPPTVDPWICHVATALLTGATLVYADPVSGPPLADRLRAHQVTHAFLPAMLFRLLAGENLPGLRMIATAGDACVAADVRAFPNARVFNIYGPTEATVTAIVAELHHPADPVPIGRAIRGLGARVVIDRAAGAPPGVPGELMLSGTGIALGYLDDEPLTRRSFGADPFGSSERVYYTGDVAWLTPDGQFVVSGRLDREVKVRGIRVQPQAVEAAALASGLCGDAHLAATRFEAGRTVLTLFVQGCTDIAALRRALRDRVPAAAEPHHIVALDSLPRRPTGKVDETALPREHLPRPPTGHDATGAYEDDVLSRCWAEVIGAPPGPDDSFFECGGDSLTVLRLVRLTRGAGLELTPADIYAYPRYSDLARLYGLRSSDETVQTVPSPAERHIPLGPAQEWFQALAPDHPRAWAQRHVIAFTDLPATSALERALRDLVAATPLLRASFDDQGRRFIPREEAPVVVTSVDAGVGDPELSAVIAALHGELDPFAGVMLRALAIRDAHGQGALLLLAHHLVVDVWSWHVIEDRLLRLLRSPRDQGPATVDHTFAAYARTVAAQRDLGAFDLDADQWRRVLGGGITSGFAARSRHRERSVRLITAGRERLRRASAQPSRTLLAALGHALYAVEGPGASVVDLERNGRLALPAMDLSGTVGWVAVHHPVALEHAPLSAAAIEECRRSVDEVPDSGLGYGALRWSGRADLGSQVGRFALDIVEQPLRPQAAKFLADRLRALARAVTGSPALPYQATLSLRPGPRHIEAVIDYDPDRYAPAHAADLLAALDDALDTADSRPAPPHLAPARPARRFTEEALPVSTMQQLMLHHAGVRSGVYLPRQLLAVTGVSDVAAFIGTLSRLLPAFDPFRRRFRTRDGELEQVWLPADRALQIHTGGSGRDHALAWLNGPDLIDPAAARHGGPLTDLTVFPGDHEFFLGMETHHALMDGPSNQRLLRLIDRFARHQGRADLPTPAHYLPDRTALRKHVSYERALGQARNVEPLPARDSAAPLPAVRTIETPAARISRAHAWASRHGTDLRAALAAAAGRAAWRHLGVETLYLVVNGRDIDLPHADYALGLLWYFQPIPIRDKELAALAHAVHAATTTPLPVIRATAATWPQWNDNALAFTFRRPRRQPPLSAVHELAARDLFHFSAQVSVSAQNDGSAAIQCITLDPTVTPEITKDILAAFD